LRFLQESMTSDVTDGYLRGSSALFQSWVVFSSYFDDIQVDLQSMEQRTKNSLLATTCTSFMISANTLRLVFPHMNSDGHGGVTGGTWSPLAKRLEGQRIVVNGTVRFDWDSVNRRVTRIMSTSDMITAMLQVVDSLDGVSYIFNGARVTPDCRLVGQNEYLS
ncbi:hypothetical protein PHMEG_00038185, partial [Phytophthora megakarya]